MIRKNNIYNIHEYDFFKEQILHPLNKVILCYTINFNQTLNQLFKAEKFKRLKLVIGA